MKEDKKKDKKYEKKQSWTSGKKKGTGYFVIGTCVVAIAVLVVVLWAIAKFL